MDADFMLGEYEDDEIGTATFSAYLIVWFCAEAIVGGMNATEESDVF
jgi:hypothetical protein